MLLQLLDLVPLLAAFASGACIGSFLNVVIFRLPAGESLLHPGSHCPKCLHALSPQENIPIIGWFLLGGRCKHCRDRISPRYPAIEALTGLLFVMVLGHFGLTWQTPWYWILSSWLVALAMIDFDTMLLPNYLTKPGLILGLLAQGCLGFVNTGTLSSAAQHLMLSIVGMVIGIWLFESVAWLGSAILGQQAMGGGDAKLAAMLGAWLGWKLLLIGGFIAALLGALLGKFMIQMTIQPHSTVQPVGKRQAFPFGPYLAVGAFLSLLYGEKLWQLYLSFFFPSLAG